MSSTIHGTNGPTDQPTGYPALGALRPHWASQGRCSSTAPDALFVRGAAQQGAKEICRQCPVIADALDNRIEYGVWGGMTERERRAMLLRHPHVPSWWNLFQTARLDQAHAS